MECLSDLVCTVPLPTGLMEAAEDKVIDYNILMKDFPVKQLLEADSLESIQTAVAAVWNHFGRIVSTAFPPQRCIYLVEAISRDLLVQLLKVCVASKVTTVSLCTEFHIELFWWGREK